MSKFFPSNQKQLTLEDRKRAVKDQAGPYSIHKS